ncbi:helix-turn-helix transcriptional regulator [Leptolyngbya sp. 15MV]|nr:helix-turn-helix transcriptional regulator [Leptolyngbya sp. 15MV]
MLREWRQRRRRSQLDLALAAEVSQRHLSYLESGRAAHSRKMVLRLARFLEIPLRERNALLLAAGFAPAFPQRRVRKRAPRIANLPEWRAHLLERLAHQAALLGDPSHRSLLEELRGYPGGDATYQHEPNAVAVPLRLRVPGGELSFLSTTTVFGTPMDVTLSELFIESFLPADASTAEALRARGD